MANTMPCQELPQSYVQNKTGFVDIYTTAPSGGTNLMHNLGSMMKHT
jgi:hypothetical protein